MVHNLSTEGESEDHEGHHASSSGQSIEAVQLLRLPRHQGVMCSDVCFASSHLQIQGVHDTSLPVKCNWWLPVASINPVIAGYAKQCKYVAALLQDDSLHEDLSPQVVYKRYASLYFVMGIDMGDNELITLEIIHHYVEVLDRYFGNVCELDLIFNFHKVWYTLKACFLAPFLIRKKGSVLRPLFCLQEGAESVILGRDLSGSILHILPV